jgi:hypothetical protein
MVFGSAALQHWGMENRLTRDVDVQMSKSSTNLEHLIGVLTPDVQMRDHAGPEPDKPYVEVMPASEDYTQPEFCLWVHGLVRIETTDLDLDHCKITLRHSKKGTQKVAKLTEVRS